VLRRCGIERAFLHGGTSSGIAMGRGPAGTPWTVALDVGAREVIDLIDEAFSVSDPAAQTAHRGARSHIVDPRAMSDGRKVGGSAAAQPGTRVAVTGPSARLADAWSTALSVLGEIPPAFPRGYTARWL
jgi:thiamine biosynthesis lipoprotein ApbE